MSNKKPNNKKAFAIPAYTDPLAGKGQNNSHEMQSGMDLRDYFAAKAMQALITNIDWQPESYEKMTAATAYDLADAMMKQREI